MSTDTDGLTVPSVGPSTGSDDDAEGRVAGASSGPDPRPPLPRRGGPSPDTPGDDGADPEPPPPPRRGGREVNGTPSDSGSWVQEEIQRRIAARGVGDTGRHSRLDRARTSPGDTAGPDPSPDRHVPPRDGTPGDGTARDETPGVGTPGVETSRVEARDGEVSRDEAPRPVGERVAIRRTRSTRVPDPYAPDGMRDATAGGFTPEQPFRMPGPAADAPGQEAGPVKEWPPADGAAGLPRRVPGAGWTLDRRALLGDALPAGTAAVAPPVLPPVRPRGPVGPTPPDGTAAPAGDADPRTRMVPTLWTAAGSDAGPPTADLGRLVDDSRVRAAAHDDEDDEDLDDDLDDLEDDDDLDDLAPTGLASGDTEVIWRAPGFDDGPAPAPTPLPPVAEPGPSPYTGPRPRRFAGAVTDAEPVEAPDREPCPALDDAPSRGRKRIVLSERRAVAHSVRTVVDVQDPGPVGTMFRSRLVTTQLNVALRVGIVALLGIAILPALFAAFPSIGEFGVLGVPLPWILLGLLVYPFLLLLGWWYVGSAERIESDFVQEVQDR